MVLHQSIGKLKTFNDINRALSYIESKRTKRTLEQFKATVIKYGFNYQQKKMIHIAGTNGKGSTTNYLKEILMAHGYQVGTFTSPYIICHNDRICINGQMISDDELLSIINELIPIIEQEQLSMFEIDTLIMLKYFNDNDLDFRIIETGIGGLNDKTNIIDSYCSVITNIGYDHQFMLGNTLEEIARHKAGIIKKNQICYTTETNCKLIDIFKSQCQVCNSQLKPVKIDCDYSYPYHFTCLNHRYTLKNCASYQVSNATLAINIANDLIAVDPKLIQQALNKAHWPGRFEKFGNIYLDGAHNIDGIKALIKTINDQKISDVLIVFSALKDKDIKLMKGLLAGFDLIEASFQDERSTSRAPDFKIILKANQDKYQNIIVTGSLHFISAVRKYLLTSKNDN